MTPSGFLKFNDVGFSYPGLKRDLLAGVNLHFTPGWTGIAGPNGTGKTTILLLACGYIQPNRGTIAAPALAHYCAQRTEQPPAAAEAFLQAEDGRSRILKSRLKIDDDWLLRWNKLSHGERKRLQIATSLYREPDLLAVDEPANHLDAEGRTILAQALGEYTGIGLLVSHDRQLLDDLCSHCVFIAPPSVLTRPGNYSEAAAQIRREEQEMKRKYSLAAAEETRLRREYIQRKQKTANSARGHSKRKLAKNDSDSREKIDRARVTGQDGARARLSGQMNARLEKARRKTRDTPFKKEYALGIEILGEIYPGNTILTMPAVPIPLGPGQRLVHPNLYLGPRDRVDLAGPNGCGKSTLMNLIRKSLTIPDDKVIYIPQELGPDRVETLLGQMRALPRDQLGWVLNLVSRLGTRPEQLLASQTPSPGEARKLFLALGLVLKPWLVMMDEPTNHLDLPSLTCLEQALAYYQGALLLISHDQRFTGRLTEKRWEIAKGSDREGGYILNAC